MFNFNCNLENVAGLATCIVSIAAAAVLADRNIYGWGWFLGLGFVMFVIVYAGDFRRDWK